MSREETEKKLGDSGIQEVQNYFCKLHHVGCQCISKDYPVTQFTYDEEQKKFTEQYFNLQEEIASHAFVSMHELEEVSIQHVEKGPIRISFLTIQVGQTDEITWIICGIISELLSGEERKKIEENNIMSTNSQTFDEVVDFLSLVSKQILLQKEADHKIIDEVTRIKKDSRDTDAKMRKLEVMNEILKLSESPSEIETVIHEIFIQAAGFLNASSACLYRLNKFQPNVDMVCEWTADGIAPRKHRMQQIALESLPLRPDKTYMISSSTPVPDECRKYFEEQGITALMTFPIKDRGNSILLMEITENFTRREWELDEIKFANEVKEIVQEVVENRLVRNSLTGSYISLESVLEHTGSGICVLDFSKEILLFANRRFKEIFLPNGTIDEERRLFKNTKLTAGVPVYVEQDNRDSCWVDVHCSKIEWVNGMEATLLTVFDVSDFKRFQHESERKVNIDVATGLYNRKRCELDLEMILQESAISHTKGAVICINIDDFKHINSRFGVQEGDSFLRNAAERLKSIESVGKRVYRLRSDEFYIIVEDEQFDQLEEIIADIRTAFQKPWKIQDMEVEFTASMGVITFPEYGQSLYDLEQNVEVAMYEAKKKGKNKVAYFNTEMAVDTYKQLDMQQRLKSAVRDGCEEFEVYFQPIMNISGKIKCCGAEALLRWKSETLGTISPTVFIPLAEQHGLINQLGEYVLYEACSRCKYWNDFGHPEYQINVNFSVIQLMKNDIVEKVKHVLSVTRLNPRNLIIEITETMEVESMRRMNEILAEFRILGVRVALDDFGTGYSSLSHVRDMLIDTIKVDQCFVNDIATDKYADTFVKMVAELAATINVKVCVEGLENEEQLKLLKEMDIQYAQGYYFGKPMPKEEFEKAFLE